MMPYESRRAAGPMPSRHHGRGPANDLPSAQPLSRPRNPFSKRQSGGEIVTPDVPQQPLRKSSVPARPSSMPAKPPTGSELQRLRLLYLRQRPHAGEHIQWQFAVDLDQRDGVAARRFAADMEGRDIDAGI